MKRITASILSVLLILSMVFSSSVFAADKVSAWDSIKGLFSAKMLKKIEEAENDYEKEKLMKALKIGLQSLSTQEVN